MKNLLLASLVAAFSSACVVLSPSGVKVVEDSKHPHGGPPGQAKHKHGKKCGHAAKTHKGKTVYVVGDHHEDEHGLVIVIKD